MPLNRPRARSPLVAALRLAFRLVCAPVILLDELVRPLYRPLVRRLAALAPMQAFERWVAGLAPVAILVLLVVPYVVVEPLKVLTVLWIAHGHVRMGTLLFVLVYLVSFVVVERIFSAGRPKLMGYRWLAWIVTTAAAVRARVTAWLRLDALRLKTRALWRLARLRLR